MSLTERIRFYIWCNMHWHSRLEITFPLIFQINRIFITIRLVHPKLWFSPIETHKYRSARTEYRFRTGQITEEQLYDEILF